MTVKDFLKYGDKRTKKYKDVKLYIDIVKHHKGTTAANQEEQKQVIDIIGIKA